MIFFSLDRCKGRTHLIAAKQTASLINTNLFISLRHPRSCLFIIIVRDKSVLITYLLIDS